MCIQRYCYHFIRHKKHTVVYCVENEFCFFELNLSDVSRASVTVILLFFGNVYLLFTNITNFMIYFNIKQQFKAFKGQKKGTPKQII